MSAKCAILELVIRNYGIYCEILCPRRIVGVMVNKAFFKSENTVYELLLLPETYISLATLTAMEVVLGIDNIIFISILVDRLPEHQREKGRKLGLLGALVTRLVLLYFIAWIVGLTEPLFSVFGVEFSGKALILLGGGLFLLYKATHEIHEKLEGPEQSIDGGASARALRGFWGVITQIMILDLVFSIDSVITAVGMAQHISIMVAANIIALCVMLLSSGYISSFVARHPTIKMLALSFLLMIGLLLIGEAMGLHIPKGYAYFAMGFSVFVEILNLRQRKSRNPVVLHNTPVEPKETGHS